MEKKDIIIPGVTHKLVIPKPIGIANKIIQTNHMSEEEKKEFEKKEKEYLEKVKQLEEEQIRNFKKLNKQYKEGKEKLHPELTERKYQEEIKKINVEHKKGLEELQKEKPEQFINNQQNKLHRNAINYQEKIVQKNAIKNNGRQKPVSNLDRESIRKNKKESNSLGK